MKDARTDLLKWIGILSMVIDHVGYIFFPEEEWFRSVGRLAFPIFAYLIAEGTLRTSNKKQYSKRH